MPRLQNRSLSNDNLCADGNSSIQIGYICVYKPKAPRGDGASDRLRLISPMNPVDRLTEIKCASAHWIARTASHESWEIRLPRNHFGRRRPIWPFRLSGDSKQSLPLKSLAADPDTIAECTVISLDQVKVPV